MPILNALRPQHSQGTNLITKEKWLEKIANGEITDATTTMYQIIDDNEYATVDQIIDTLTKNVGAHLSNDNLLDNCNFKINQSGLSEYNKKGYTVDRWNLEIDNAKVVPITNGITLSTDGTDTTENLLAQYISNPKDYIGTTLTLTAKYSNYSAALGYFSAGIIARNAGYEIVEQAQAVFVNSDDSVSVTFTVPKQTSYLQVGVNKSTNNATASINLQWMKLEVGDKSTIYCAPNLAEELLVIQSKKNDGASKLLSNNTVPTIMNSQMVDNTNFIINPDFKINQNGKTVYDVETEAYTVDGWMKNRPATVTVTDTGLSISYTEGSTSFNSIYQMVENADWFREKTLTFSAKLNGRIFKCTGTFPAEFTDGEFIAISENVNTAHLQLRYQGGYLMCLIYGATTVEWAKLELGNEATAFVPPNPALELLKCQRYYHTGRFAFRMSDAYFSKDIVIPPMIRFPVAMRDIPTVTIYSTEGTIGTLSNWSDRSDSTEYTTCVARTLDNEGFNAIGTTSSNFTDTDTNWYIGYYTASARL